MKGVYTIDTLYVGVWSCCRMAVDELGAFSYQSRRKSSGVIRNTQRYGFLSVRRTLGSRRQVGGGVLTSVDSPAARLYNTILNQFIRIQKKWQELPCVRGSGAAPGTKLILMAEMSFGSEKCPMVVTCVKHNTVASATNRLLEPNFIFCHMRPQAHARCECVRSNFVACGELQRLYCSVGTQSWWTVG